MRDKMKKILFCIENFQHGGINRALENLLSVFDHTRHDVGIFVVNQEEGPYKQLFAPYLKYTKDHLLEAYCTYYHKHHGFRRYALLALKSWRKIVSRLGHDPFKARLHRWARRIGADGYDCVIAFAEGYITEFVAGVRGHKAAWIHIDYKRYLTYTGHPDEAGIYGRFANVVIPSQFSAKSFIDTYPALKDKIKCIPNVISSDMVRREAASGKPTDASFCPGGFSIISVGRICYEKRFFEIPVIAKALRDKGVNFKWYIIGDGSPAETATLDKAIKENGVGDSVIHLGRKDNPYPYIAQCDLLVSTSLSETFSYVVFEAKSLGVPVVCADFGTAPEILNDTEGLITPLSSMAEAINNLYTDRDSLLRLKANLQAYEYDYPSVLNKIYEIL